MNINKNAFSKQSKRIEYGLSDENLDLNTHAIKDQPQFPKGYENEWYPNPNYKSFNNVNKLIPSQRVELSNLGLNKSINISFNEISKPALNKPYGKIVIFKLFKQVMKILNLKMKS